MWPIKSITKEGGQMVGHSKFIFKEKLVIIYLKGFKKFFTHILTQRELSNHTLQTRSDLYMPFDLNNHLEYELFS